MCVLHRNHTTTRKLLHKESEYLKFQCHKLSVLSLKFFENEKGSRYREFFQPISVTSHPASSYWEKEKKSKRGRKCRREMKGLQKQSLFSSQCYPSLSSQTHQFSFTSEIFNGKWKVGQAWVISRELKGQPLWRWMLHPTINTYYGKTELSLFLSFISPISVPQIR